MKIIKDSLTKMILKILQKFIKGWFSCIKKIWKNIKVLGNVMLKMEKKFTFSMITWMKLTW